MKIKVDEIPDEGLNISEKIEPQRLSVDLSKQCIDFISSIEASARLTKSGKEVFADMTLEAPVEYTCARCLSKFQSVIKKKFNINYEVNSGDVMELDDDIRQEMMLDYPMKTLCKDDCKGLCPNCGQNLNIGKCECK